MSPGAGTRGGLRSRGHADDIVLVEKGWVFTELLSDRYVVMTSRLFESEFSGNGPGMCSSAQTVNEESFNIKRVSEQGLHVRMGSPAFSGESFLFLS